MSTVAGVRERLASIPSLQITEDLPLKSVTRFDLGGPADLFVDTINESAFIEALRAVQESGVCWMVIGLGTNLVVSDEGYRGVVLRYRGGIIDIHGSTLHVQAGAALQSLVDTTIANGLAGIEKMTGIPGNVGAAVYGNAGAYGASISDVVKRVRFFDGLQVREADRAECEFRYRGSAFKQQRLSGKAWLIISAEFEMVPGDAAALKGNADKILTIRNAKYPPEMKCAGSIFKNLILAELPERARAVTPQEIVKGGKVPSAWYLEECGAKGLARGGIHVTEYHANTLYNAGGGTAHQFHDLVEELKERVRARFGIELEEEVQIIE